MVSVVNGAALILPSGQFDALATLEAVHRERATALYGVPTMYIAELEHPEFERFDLSSLRKGIMSGAPCPLELMKRAAETHAHRAHDHPLRPDRVLPGHHHGQHR